MFIHYKGYCQPIVIFIVTRCSYRLDLHANSQIFKVWHLHLLFTPTQWKLYRKNKNTWSVLCSLIMNSWIFTISYMNLMLWVFQVQQLYFRLTWNQSTLQKSIWFLFHLIFWYLFYVQDLLWSEICIKRSELSNSFWCKDIDRKLKMNVWAKWCKAKNWLVTFCVNS